MHCCSWEAALDAAAALAVQYDYDGAIQVLTSQEGYEEDGNYMAAITEYENQKASCVEYPLEEITHVFFHTLINDTARAFDGDYKTDGYNQMMTTVTEFNRIIQILYDKGYVMVIPHDMAVVDEDGTMNRGKILLPPGKTPFVISQDDVSYYHYMDGDGFASKLVLDENGEVKAEYVKSDGTTVVGDYDMVPLLDTFLKTHPDFDYDEEVRQATEVANALKAEGWEFASHTWGHRNAADSTAKELRRDNKKWEAYVAPIVGKTDMIIFAFGADIGDWNEYTTDNPKYKYYRRRGYRYFCNVDSNQYWVQITDDYFRQGRRNLDGYRMYYNPEMLSDLFDVSEVWDESRPVPVPSMLDSEGETEQDIS